jgi:hypothetical protein
MFNYKLHYLLNILLVALLCHPVLKATNYWVQYQATIPSGNYSIIFEMSASIYDNYKILKLDDIAVQPGECSEGNVICS